MEPEPTKERSFVVDISNDLRHPDLIRPGASTGLTFSDLRKKVSAVEVNKLGDCYVSVSLSTVVARKMMKTGVKLCFDVRQAGYVLSAETFEESNLLVLNHKELKFVKLLGKPLVKGVDTYEDFSGLADFITKSLFPSNIPIEVTKLVFVLRLVDTDNNPMLNRHHIICNYALMNNTMRASYLTFMYHKLRQYNSGFGRPLTRICSRFYERKPWFKKLTKSDNVYQIYSSENSAYSTSEPTDLLKLVRHCIVHLGDNSTGVLDSDDAYIVMASYYGEFIDTLFFEVFWEFGVTNEEYYKFEP